MATIKNTFVKGVMNKDVDERLVPEGTYVHAENIKIASNDNSDGGVIKNKDGNELLSSLSLTNACVIGGKSDDSHNKLYWFVTSDEGDYIYEYEDADIPSITRVLGSLRVDGITVLNFQKTNRILDIVKIKSDKQEYDLLAWTDDLNPPRLINIHRAKQLAIDGFNTDTISLIKKPPMYAPTTRFTYSKTTAENYLKDNFVSFSYRYIYEDGEHSALSSFTNYKFAPGNFELEYPSMENIGMENVYNAVEITFNTGDELVKSIDLVYKESGSNTVYTIASFDKSKEGWLDDDEKLYVFDNSKINKVLPDDELFRTYDNVPLKAKALELVNDRLVFGNYTEGYDLIDDNDDDILIDYNVSLSTIGFESIPIINSVKSRSFPLPEVYGIQASTVGVSLLKGTKLVFTFNLRESDVGAPIQASTTRTGYYRDSFEFIITKDYVDGGELTSDPDFIFFIESVVTNHFSINYTPAAFTTEKPIATFSDITAMLAGAVFEDRVYYVEDASLDASSTIYNGEYYRANENYGYDVPLLLTDFTRLTGDERDLFIPKVASISTTEPFRVEPLGWYGFDITFPRTTYHIVYTPLDDPEYTFDDISAWRTVEFFMDIDLINLGIPFSLKSNRSYESGILYLDGYNRASTVLTNNKHTDNNDNTLFVPSHLAINQNRMRMSINNNPPSWATRYKVVIKENKGDYHNIYTNTIYREGIYRWIKLEGDSIHKVKEGDELVVKSDSGGFLEEIIKTKVLAIETKDKDFILGNTGITYEDIIEESGVYMKIRPSGFAIDAYASRAITELSGEQSLRYVRPCYTEEFGEFTDAATPVFVPYTLEIGDNIHIEISVQASGSISFSGKYDEEFVVGNTYASVAEWFAAEVVDLGEFGIKYTWDGVDNLAHDDDYLPIATDPLNKGTGWGFSDGDYADAGNQKFYIFPYRDGTASRDIRSSVKFTIKKVTSSVMFETIPPNFNSDVFYETEETFDIIKEGGLSVHSGNIQNQSKIPHTSGVLVVGNGYYIKTLNVGDDFSNTGALNVEGEIFIATVDTPISWVNGSVILDTATSILDYGNCYTQGNGIESYRHNDSFDTKALRTDIRPTAVADNGYKSIRRYFDLTYSEPFSNSSNTNGLNEFNLSRANYKDDINKKFGAIQKIYSRDTDLLLFQEDKISKVLYGKSMLMNAEGSHNISLIDNVLGTQLAYPGDYGISSNPESLAEHSNSLFFTDAKRGVVLELNDDSIQEISNLGMNSWFKNEFRGDIDCLKLGAYDDYNNQYVLHIDNVNKNTLAYSDNSRTKGWSSFYSYIPEHIINMNNKLYSFKNGELYVHDSENVNKCFFYGDNYPSKLSITINENVSDTKVFKALNLEGSHPWDILYSTNLTSGTITIPEFVKKEGEWYAYIRRNEDSLDNSSFAFQGIGEVQSIDTTTFYFTNVSSDVSNGDTLFTHEPIGDTLVPIGVIESHDTTSITVTTVINPATIGALGICVKNYRIEGAEARGYYMNLDMTSNEITSHELYAVNVDYAKSFQ